MEMTQPNRSMHQAIPPTFNKIEKALNRTSGQFLSPVQNNHRAAIHENRQ
jgi:hypothetical protein